MELHLMRKRKWIVAMALFGVSSYGSYKLYHLPSVTRKRKKLFKLFAALISLTETVSDPSDVISLVSRDLKQYLQSDSDEIPRSLKQLSEIARSNGFSESMATVTEAVSLGLLKFYKRKEVEIEHSSSLSDRFMDKIMSEEEDRRKRKKRKEKEEEEEEKKARHHYRVDPQRRGPLPRD